MQLLYWCRSEQARDISRAEEMGWSRWDRECRVYVGEDDEQPRKWDAAQFRRKLQRGESGASKLSRTRDGKLWWS